jgi:hypothetical protein
LCSFFSILLKNIPLPKLSRFNSHFNAIMKCVTGNMADDCVALMSIESARTQMRTAMVRSAWITLIKRSYFKEHGDGKHDVLQFWISINIGNAMSITVET